MLVINSEQMGALRRFLNEERRVDGVPPLGLTMALRSFLFFEQLGDALGDVFLVLPLGTASTEGTDVAETEVPLPLSDELFAVLDRFLFRLVEECFLVFTFDRFFVLPLRRFEDLRELDSCGRFDFFLRIFFGGLIAWKSSSALSSSELELIEELRLLLLLLSESDVELWSVKSSLLPVDEARDLRCFVVFRLRWFIAGWPRMLNFTSS